MNALGACRELAPSKQESTTYEPSPVCKLLILGCRLLIPDRLLAVAVKPCWDVLAQTWDAISLAKDCLVTALRLLNEAKNIRELFRRRRPKKHRVAAHEVTARITFGAPTATARVSVSPPVWL